MAGAGASRERDNTAETTGFANVRMIMRSRNSKKTAIAFRSGHAESSRSVGRQMTACGDKGHAANISPA
jgi:hypothetical protein